jgi:hypothetical protein
LPAILSHIHFDPNYRGQKMFNNRCLVAKAALVSLVLLGTSVATADEQPCYTVASIQGTYALVATYSANVALALGVRHFDGQGNLTGTFVLNAPVAGSPTGARTIITGTQVGTYAVNCDGTGTITRTLTSSSGVVTTQTDNLLITKVVKQESGRLAISLEDATQTPSALVPGGLFVFRSYTRQSD